MVQETMKVPNVRPSWFSRFWAVVRYEMLWNIRKKKFIGVLILGFALASVALFLTPILRSATGQAITSNADYVATYTIPALGLFLFALATAMNIGGASTGTSKFRHGAQYIGATKSGRLLGS